MLSSGFAPALINGAGAASKDDGGRGGGGEDVLMMEHLFDMVLTLSDVGDLLWIPRQHIAKLANVAANNEQAAGIIFLEDRAVAGKLWRLDSYWTSDRLGVTKDWGLGLFVKEKGLGAGDTISFFRSAGDGRLFIDCSRRQPDAWTPRSVSAAELHSGVFPWPPAAISHGGHEGRVGELDIPAPVNQATAEMPQQVPCSGLDEMPAHLLPRPRRPRRNRVQPDQPVVVIGNPTILESTPLVHSPEAKRVRLFGVYLN